MYVDSWLLLLIHCESIRPQPNGMITICDLWPSTSSYIPGDCLLLPRQCGDALDERKFENSKLDTSQGDSFIEVTMTLTWRLFVECPEILTASIRSTLRAKYGRTFQKPIFDEEALLMNLVLQTYITFTSHWFKLLLCLMVLITAKD